MKKNSSNETLEVLFHDVDYMKLCLDLTVYWVGSVFDRVDGVLAFYRSAMELVGTDIRFYETESMRGARKAKADTLDLLPFWLTESPKRREMYMLYLESSPSANIPSDKAFVFVALEDEGEQVGLMRLILPADFAEGSADSLVELVRELTDSLDFHSGHAGFGLNWNDRGDLAYDAQKQMRGLGMRFPGIDIPDLETTLYAIPNGIKRINWLTLLGNTLVENLGGYDYLESELRDGIS
ncbi:MAG: DUF3396 domain-containing protein, partial [Pseudomonadota bacterium]|nr:DUF3396 domain-containing protein [Pseudomonadota bacterium]